MATKTDKQAIRFHAISADVDASQIDSAAEAVARRRGIPTLKAPVERDAPDLPMKVAPETTKALPQASSPTKGGGRYVKVWCPDYLLDELLAKAASSRVTLNYLVLLALRDSGYRVAETDLIPDGRALRGKGANG